MSFSFNKGVPYALIKGGEYDGEILFVDKDADVKKPRKKCCKNCDESCEEEPCCGGCNMCHKGTGNIGRDIELDDGEFEILPNPETRVSFLGGKSGSGKTTEAAKLIANYLKLWPDSQFILFSRVKEDEGIDFLDPHRVMIDESLINEPVDVTQDVTPHTVVLFDDVGSIPDKKIKDAVLKLIQDVAEIGRHSDVKLLVTNHLLNPNEKTFGRVILNEMHTVTFFPQCGQQHQINVL